MKYLQADQVYSTTGTHYDPMQRALLNDSREVWIARQDGDGKQGWYYTDQNEQIDMADVKEWTFTG